MSAKNSANSIRNGKSGLEILEEAAHLLRHAPAGSLLCYYAGSLPFVLGLLFFWTDMSLSGTARLRLIDSSFAMALLFIWMKCWQAAFASKLLSMLTDSPSARWGARRVLRLVGIQTAAMPWELVILPLAALVTLPFGWCLAFFHNLSVLGSGDCDFRTSFLKARHQSTLQPGQNHVILLILTLFSLVVLINVCAGLYLAPILLNSLTGIETTFSMGRRFFLNSTFWLTAFGLTYLCLNPLAKAAYVLRCYYGDSLRSGRDLLSELRCLRRIGSNVLILLLALPAFLLPFAATRNACAASSLEIPSKVSASSGEKISPKEIEEAVSAELSRLEYTWRGTKTDTEPPEVSTGGFLAKALETIGGWLAALWGWIGNGVEWILKWLVPLLKPHSEAKSPVKTDTGIVRAGLWAALALSAALALLLVFVHLRRKAALSENNEKPLMDSVPPNLEDEETLPDVLPASKWMDMAEGLRLRGELRLALRAYFFAALAHLAHCSLLSIARFKSNRDYQRELERRGHAYPELSAFFLENVAILERSWYGMHELSGESFERFLNNQERIMKDVR